MIEVIHNSIQYGVATRVILGLSIILEYIQNGTRNSFIQTVLLSPGYFINARTIIATTTHLFRLSYLPLDISLTPRTIIAITTHLFRLSYLPLDISLTPRTRIAQQLIYSDCLTFP